MNIDFAHETITVERTLNASPELVFDAWSDPVARCEWGPPSDDEAIEFLENDFSRGGMDVSMCGQLDDLRFRVETLYHDIEKPHRLLFTERVLTNNSLLCVSQITMTLVEMAENTQLTLTIQVVSLVGEEMIASNRNGWNAATENLTKRFR